MVRHLAGTQPGRKEILLSIHPTFVAKILDGSKTVELRRRFPDAVGATLLIYSTSPVQAVVGSAKIKDVVRLPIKQIWQRFGSRACIEKSDFLDYFTDLPYGCALILESVRKLKRETKLAEMQSTFGVAAPQSYRYLNSKCLAMMNDGQIQASRRYKHSHRA